MDSSSTPSTGASYRFEPDPALIEELRSRARAGCTVPELVRGLCERLGEDASRLYVVVYLRQAFRIAISEAKPVGAWRFFEGGTWSDEEIEAEIGPAIRRSRHLWDG